MPNLLLEEENIIQEYLSGKLILTSHRISKKLNSDETTVILIENVDSISTELKDKPTLYLVGVFLAIIGFILSGTNFERFQNLSSFIIGSGIILVIIYFFTRKMNINIVSNGGTHLEIGLGNFSKSEIESLICKIMIQKNKRLKEIQSLNN